MKKLVKINAELLVKALGIAATGGGKGFLLLIQPGSALVASCDGTKVGRCHFETESEEGIDEPVILYPVKSFYKTAETIAKFTDTICVELKDSYIELSDAQGGSRVRVALNESDVMFDLTQEESETAVFVSLKTEDFVKLVRSGGAAASKATDAMKAMFFHVNGSKLELATKSSPMIAYASVETETVKNAEKNETWHPANDQFLNTVIGNIDGEICQIGFTNLNTVITTERGAVYIARRMNLEFKSSVLSIIEMEERDYEAEISKKDLLLGLEVSTVGIDKVPYVVLRTEESGNLLFESPNGENRMEVIQKSHKGQLQARGFSVDIVKTGVTGCSDTVSYYGMNDKYSAPIHISGKDGNVEYNAVIAPHAMDKKEETKKAEVKTAEKTK